MLKKLILVGLILGGAILVPPVFALDSVHSSAVNLGPLVKTTSSSAVYYLDGNNRRHLFPTAAVYKSWYPDYSGVRVISAKNLSQYPLGRNITIRPGINIVTFDNDPDYYAVATGGVLRLFDDQDLISNMYGEKWLSRVVKLPDVFFNDYVQGDKIASERDLPDGIVYRQSAGKQYFYKYRGIIWPFKDDKSLRDNNFKLKDVVINDANYARRQTVIAGWDKNVFNPAVEPQLDNSDCENKKLKAAFVLVTKGAYTPEQIEKISNIQRNLPAVFKLATDGLSEINTDFPLTIINAEGDLLFMDIDSQLKPANEVINNFYDNNFDIFDFIILYNNFVTNEPAVAKYLMINNSFEGTGNNQTNIASVFGSRGKLKGVANMGNIAKYDATREKSLGESDNFIIHEILHHWSGRATFIDADGQLNYDLLRAPGFDHWSPYNDSISLLGGSGWRDNGDGTYTNKLSLGSPPAQKMTPLDLYFMGLWPKVAMTPVHYLVPSDPNSNGNIIRGEMKSVSIDQITAAMGEWRCKTK